MSNQDKLMKNCGCATPYSNEGGTVRAVIVAGLRTPFVKAGTCFQDRSAVDLASSVVCELIKRSKLDPNLIDNVIFGQVLPNPQVINIARELVIANGLPSHIEAFTVARACATGTQALVSAAQSICTGISEVVVCGGVESLSNPPITIKPRFSRMLMQLGSAKNIKSKLGALSKFRLGDLVPVPPTIKEASTGLTMGESAEVMAKANGILRSEQDALALASHKKAAMAYDSGIYDNEVMPIKVRVKGKDSLITRDTLLRCDTSLEKLATLKPVFDTQAGTITAGNSSALTDGAAACLVMSEERALALGFSPLAYIRAYAFAAVDPKWQLLAAPPIAAAKALALAKLTLADIDIIDLHEAFAAQVLSNIQAFSSREFAARFLKSDKPIGEIDPQKLNIHGGSIALGHPFGATGARQATTMANELARRGSGRALIAQCTAQGMGAALILER